MPADTGLEENEVIRIPRRQWQVVRFFEADGPAGADARRIHHRRAAADFHHCSDCTYFQLRVDGRFRAGIENYIRMALRVEPGFLNGHRVRTEREIGKYVIAVFSGASSSGKAG